jgi:hypothetical protein
VSATHKSGGPAAAKVDTFWTGYAKGLEGLADLGRQVIDRSAQQNRDLANAFKTGVDLVVETVQQTGQAQRELLDVVVERGKVVSRLAADNVESVAKAAEGVTAVFESVRTFATAAQKKAVDFATTQNAAAYETAKRQFEASGSAMVETFQRGVDTLLETQRVVLRARDAV